VSLSPSMLLYNLPKLKIQVQLPLIFRFIDHYQVKQLTEDDLFYILTHKTWIPNVYVKKALTFIEWKNIIKKLTKKNIITQLNLITDINNDTIANQIEINKNDGYLQNILRNIRFLKWKIKQHERAQKPNFCAHIAPYIFYSYKKLLFDTDFDEHFTFLFYIMKEFRFISLNFEILMRELNF